MLRRSLLKSAVAFPYVAKSTVLGANDRVQVGFIGVGNRARWLLEHEDFGEAQIVAVADISPWSLARALKLQPKDAKQLWRPYNDYRRMFETEKLDGVFVETTTHARVHVALGSLVDVPSIRPSEHIFVDSKAAWEIIADDLPKFAEFDGTPRITTPG